jgi:glycine cleavage system aminomethyltransferase T
VTSGTISPSTGKAIMLASLGSSYGEETKLAALVRGTPRPVRMTRLPFVPKRYKSGPSG